jgi:RNA polymerase sigma-70 factor (ECF subfamily)
MRVHAFIAIFIPRNQVARTTIRETDLSEDSPRITYGADDEIADGIRRRDPAAMEALYDRLSRQAFGLAYRILGDGPAAEDVVQEAFFAVWRQSEKVDAARGKLTSFVLTVVHHKSIDALRSKKGQMARQVSLDPALLEKEGPDVTERALLALDRDAIRDAVAALPEDQRRPVLMAYYEGKTQVEISDELGVPLGTVKSRMRLALEKMRTSLAARAGP